ncbi:MAG: SAM-dependent methyltransferase [Oscillatoria sp. PMC 1068.18]|nr:SAM-dependent methyltransferase [Oscillatoria sp. PMC 1076.18]MEC4989712.1 SAM-dependent methyltransferase [Oscillatoria sp. PMC 1068.18]
MNQSLPPEYFEKMYRENPDPWNFETSEYEAKKYQATLAALPKTFYHNALEIGGSIGVLTAMLAPLCQNLLSLDVSETAQKKAIQRCQNLPQVRFQIMRFPETYPAAIFDLILVSEVGYYWGDADLVKSQQLILEHLQLGGHLLLVHWTPYVADYPLTGDRVHDSFLKLNPEKLRHLKGRREDKYRLDLFERV